MEELMEKKEVCEMCGNPCYGKLNLINPDTKDLITVCPSCFDLGYDECQKRKYKKE